MRVSSLPEPPRKERYAMNEHSNIVPLRKTGAIPENTICL